MNNQTIDQKIQNQCLQVANMCMAMGIQKWVYQGENKTLSHMPVSLYPYKLSQQIYLKIKKAHQIWVKLLFKVSKDKQFVNNVFKLTAKSDKFVNKFLSLYNRFINKQNHGIACIRVDYMGDQNPLLVQFNLISVGLNGISDLVQKLTSIKKNYQVESSRKNNIISYPINHNQQTVLNSIQSLLKVQKIEGIIVMVVHEKSQKQFNFGDQMAFQVQSLKRGYKVKRVSMSQFINHYKVSQDKQLFLESEKVAVVYYRTAYCPSHYQTEAHWKLRQDIENSTALKLPTISMQLLNFKRMQVQLSKLEVLRKYINQEEALLIHQLSGEIYDFQNEQNYQKILELVKDGQYVLKTNRQGGGNNYFGKQVYTIIDSLKAKPQQLQKYILMKKIKSKIQQNVFITRFSCHNVKETTCQMSTLGSFAYKNDQIIFNEFGGNLIRIKKADENQGGIAIDKAVISGLCIQKKI